VVGKKICARLSVWRVKTHFTCPLPAERQAWIYAVSGELTVRVQDEARVLEAGTATTVSAGPCTEIVLGLNEHSHFVLLAAKPIRESFVKHGPLVMSSRADVRRTMANYANGLFGSFPSWVT
jgi:redox-sensitive bicupin YhaK (pirin superfamily)